MRIAQVCVIINTSTTQTGKNMNALQKMIDEAQKEHDLMWSVAISSSCIGLATIEGKKAQG